MAKAVKVEFVHYGPRRMVGKEIRTPISERIHQFWGQCFADGTFETLTAMKDYFPLEDPDAYIGYFREYDNRDESFKYVVGLLMNGDTPVPQGFVGYDVPDCLIVRVWIEGDEAEIYNSAYFLITEAMKQNGYEVDWENFYWCEVYTDERYALPKSKGEKVVTLDYYMPCKKA